MKACLRLLETGEPIGTRPAASGRRSYGFTLMELLVVLLVLAILIALALPLYLQSVSDAERRTCRSNMQTIATAVHAARVRDRANSYAPYFGPIDQRLSDIPDLLTAPRCPVPPTGPLPSTTYLIQDGSVAGAFQVRCRNVAAHGVFQMGVDSE